MPTILANWKKLVGWAVLIFVAYQAISLLVWTTAAATVSSYVAQASAFVLYLAFFRRTENRRLSLGIALFLLVQVVDIIVLFALARSLDGWLDPRGTATSFAVCVAAYFASLMSSNSSFKSKPLRGST